MGIFDGTDSSLSKFVFILFFIILFVILIAVGMNLIGMLMGPSNSPYLVKGMIPGNVGYIVSQDPSIKGYIPISRSDNQKDGLEFTWSVWLNINALANNGQYSHVFHKGELKMNNEGLNYPNNSPGVYISPDTNELVIKMNTFTTINEDIRIPNIPLNKWISLIVRVEDTTLDVYINGSLAKRHVFVSVPKQNYGDVYVNQNGGFTGYLSSLRYFTHALQPGDILSLVNEGPDLSMNTSVAGNPLLSTPPYLSLQWYTQNL